MGKNKEKDPKSFSGNERLAFYIKPGTATPEQIGELLGEFSILFKMMTGSGIDFTLENVKINSTVDYEG